MSYAIMFVAIFTVSYLILDMLERVSGELPSEFDRDPAIANEKYRRRIMDDIHARHALLF